MWPTEASGGRLPATIIRQIQVLFVALRSAHFTGTRAVVAQYILNFTLDFSDGQRAFTFDFQIPKGRSNITLMYDKISAADELKF